MKLCRAIACFSFVILLMAISASADSVVLTFEGLKSLSPVGGFYSRYGITFSVNSRAYIAGAGANFVPSPPGDTALGLRDGTEMVMDVAGGFKSALSFDYISGQDQPGSLTIYSGLDGTGIVLATLALAPSPICPSEPPYCQWTAIDLQFSGTAMSAVFGGVRYDLLIDNVNLNTVTNRAIVPEPTPLFLISTGLAGILARGRRGIKRSSGG